MLGNAYGREIRFFEDRFLNEVICFGKEKILTFNGNSQASIGTNEVQPHFTRFFNPHNLREEFKNQKEDLAFVTTTRDNATEIQFNDKRTLNGDYTVIAKQRPDSEITFNLTEISDLLNRY